MARPGAALRLRPRVLRAACLLLSGAAALSALHAALGPLPPFPADAACPGGVVLVRNARYLTRGNVGHWGYALFGLHGALAAAPPGRAPAALTLFFDARVKTGDWVRTMLAALSRRHGVTIALSHHRAGRCGEAARGGERGGAGSAAGGDAGGVWAQLDANDARLLATGREGAFRAAMRDVCNIPHPAGAPTAVRALRARCCSAHMFPAACVNARKPSVIAHAATHARTHAYALAGVQDVLIYNRHARSTRRLCNVDAVVAALTARGLSHEYVDVPSSACEQLAALSPPRRFVITPHGAHEARTRMTWHAHDVARARADPSCACGAGESVWRVAKRDGR
jgi:hypothetical protein